MEPNEGFCVRCRAPRVMKNTQSVTMKNGSPATKGNCVACGTAMFRMEKRSAVRP